MSKPVVTMTKGLPGSGKTRWAQKMVEASWDKNMKIKRINKDDLRAMLDHGHHTKSNEKMILWLRDRIMLYALERGDSVIIDDTNLAPKHEAHLREVVAAAGARFKVMDFTDVPLAQCIHNDLCRLDSVGERVIREMYHQFLEFTVSPPTKIVGVPSVILVDLDGTLAHMKGRSPYEWARVGEDTLDEALPFVIDKLSPHYPVIILSGRDEVCRPETEQWLISHGIEYDSLLMRPEGDNRKDTIVKEEIYETRIKGKLNVLCIFDDREQVVEMWRSKGLKCYQVAWGDF